MHLEQVISKCGNICSSCPWGVWVRKNQSDDEWASYVEDVKKYVGFTPTKNPCHGCQTPTENLAKDVGVHNFLRGCSARKCAFHNEIRNCAYCSRYPCDKIKALNAIDRRRDAEQRIGESIPDEKYLAYFRIFEGKKTLDEIREGLRPEEIQEAKTVEPKKSKIAEFPEVGQKYTDYRSLHNTLSIILNSKLGLTDTDTLAGQEMLQERQSILFRLLWMVAYYGEIDGESLSIDSITINAHKKGTSGFPTTEGSWSHLLEFLSKVGILGEMKLADIDRSQLISPIGWLRDRIPKSNDPAWHLKVSLDKTLGGVSSLKMLKSYAKALDEKYNRRAFSMFTKADMRFLKEKV
jgi:hypothetical protein